MLCLDNRLDDIFSSSSYMVRDEFSGKKCYIYDSLEEFKYLYGGAENLIGAIGNDLSVPVKDSLAILRNASLGQIYKDMPYNIAIKTASYHSYIELRNNQTGAKIHFGIAPTERGAMFGDVYVRNDSYYDEKYWHGFTKFTLEDKCYDRASNSVEFALTKEKAERVVNFVNNYIEQQKQDPSAYSMLGIGGKNCNIFINEVLESIDINVDPSIYYKFDEVNMFDRGMLFNYINSTSWYVGLWHGISYITTWLFGESRYIFEDEEIENLFLIADDGASLDELKQVVCSIDKSLINKFYDDDYTSALFEAIKHGYTDLAKAILSHGAIDLSLVNCEGDSAAHLAAYYKDIDVLQEIRACNEDYLYCYNEIAHPPICRLEGDNPDYSHYFIDHDQYMHVLHHVDLP